MEHSDLFTDRWHTFSLAEQLGNVGSEVGRALNWERRGNMDLANKARERALELLDLTAIDKRWQSARKREILRAREVVCDYWWGNNIYCSTAENLEKYFMVFAFYARALR